MTAITRPWQWLTNHEITAARTDQDHDAILLAQDPPGAIVRRAAVLSLTNAIFTDVTFDTQDADNDALWPGGGVNQRVTIVHDGYYLVSAGVKFASNATGVRVAAVSLNAAVLDDIADERPALAGNPRFTISGGLVLVTNDIIRLNVFQNSGGNLNVQCRLTVVRAFGPGS